jgi:lipopolysaccharide transport system ATP-binding protein
VASLLEVGTGFHPDLTGRENIYLNGAILGMTRAEIRKKFDEIVAFAEVEQFIDTPVKRYSSGMYVRLAFAVAAHLEPEILIIDEVLAVGDASFQQKCLGRMRDITQVDGRTIIFISHNMGAIQALCTRSIFLDKGRVALMGSVANCITAYLESNQSSKIGATIDLNDSGIEHSGDGRARLESLEITDASGGSRTNFAVGEPIGLRIRLKAHQRLRDYFVGFAVSSLDEQVIACSNHYDSLPRESLEAGSHVFEVAIDGLWLSPGAYKLTLAITSGDGHAPIDLVKNCTTFVVDQRLPDSNLSALNLLDSRPGYIRRPLQWRHS